MRLVTLPRPGHLAEVVVAKPEPGLHEVRILPRCVGICGSDVEVFLGHREAPVRFGHPVVGHEVSGVIDAVGEHVTGVRPGDRATCIEGWGALGGGILALPQNVLTFDDRIDLADGCLLEVLPGAAMAAWRTGASLSSDVLVVGQGLSGLVITRLLRLHGCRRLVVVDPDDAKLDVARDLGADVAHPGTIEAIAPQLATEHPNGFDLAILAMPRCVVDVVAPLMRARGRIVAYGGLDEHASVDLLALHHRSISLVKEGGFVGGTLDARRVWRDALRTVYDGLLPLRRLRTHDLPVARAQEALELRASGEETAIHVVLHHPWTGSKDDG